MDVVTLAPNPNNRRLVTQQDRRDADVATRVSSNKALLDLC